MKQREKKQPKKDITLMTLLAYEATADSRKLLKKYGKADAKSYGDLEVKLAELYFESPDKVQIEKEMAEIHPHKNWLLRNVAPKQDESSKEEEIKLKEEKAEAPMVAPTPEIIQDLKSNADGSSGSSNDDSKLMIHYSSMVAIVGITLAISVIGLSMVLNKK